MRIGKKWMRRRNNCQSTDDRRNYRYDLDLLKGLAILAVVLYHAGWFKSGYLGVDVFLLVSGFLAVPSVVRQVGEGRFSYLRYVERRVFRLLPLVLLVSGVAMVAGWLWMLPGDYRYLSEEVMASSVFAGNLLQAVTTQNYWAAIYHKVLMHNWYLGVLFQFYLIWPLVAMIASKRAKTVLSALSLLSLALYLLPIDSIGNKYYLLQYRFFELGLGGLIALLSQRGSGESCQSGKATQSEMVSRGRASRLSDAVGLFALAGLTFMIYFGAFTIGERAMPYNLVGGTNTIRESFLPRELLLLLTVAFTALFVWRGGRDGAAALGVDRDRGESIGKARESVGAQRESFVAQWARRSPILAPLGRMSLSIFLWHQPLLAFYRYLVADELSVSALVAIGLLTFGLAYLSYIYVERRVRPGVVSRWCLLAAFLSVNAAALWVYRQGGAVRDVPELDIQRGAFDPSAFERYTDRIYQYDSDFAPDDITVSDGDASSVGNASSDGYTRQRLLVIGNSFARDFANILLAMNGFDDIGPDWQLRPPATSRLQLSYHYAIDDCPLSRIRQADRIYFFGWRREVPQSVWQNLKPGAEIWGIGTKNHGSSLGIFYSHRHRPDYFRQTAILNPDFFALNDSLRADWQGRYIDLLSLTLQPDSTVAVFTPDHHFITYDGRHLTPAGVRHYAALLRGSARP